MHQEISSGLSVGGKLLHHEADDQRDIKQGDGKQDVKMRIVDPKKSRITRIDENIISSESVGTNQIGVIKWKAM